MAMMLLRSLPRDLVSMPARKMPSQTLARHTIQIKGSEPRSLEFAPDWECLFTARQSSATPQIALRMDSGGRCMFWIIRNSCCLHVEQFLSWSADLRPQQLLKLDSFGIVQDVLKFRCAVATRVAPSSQGRARSPLPAARPNSNDGVTRPASVANRKTGGGRLGSHRRCSVRPVAEQVELQARHYKSNQRAAQPPVVESQTRRYTFTRSMT